MENKELLTDLKQLLKDIEQLPIDAHHMGAFMWGSSEWNAYDKGKYDVKKLIKKVIEKYEAEN